MSTSKSPSDSTSKGWLLGWLAWAVYSCLLIEGAVTEVSKLPRFLLQFNDKLAHGTEFFVLFLITFHAFKGIRRWNRSLRLILGMVYCIFLSMVTEVMQIWAPTRSADVLDFCVDVLGASLAALSCFMWKKNKGKL